MLQASFIRYYISEMPRSLARQIQTLLPQLPALQGWRWIYADQFDYEKSFGHLPGPNDFEVECIKRKCTIVVEHHDPNAVVGSLLRPALPPSVATIIDDILLLCSIARSQYIYARAQETQLPDGGLRIRQSPVAPLSDLKEVIPEGNLEDFIVDSLSILQQHDWKEHNGFVTAIRWYAQAQRSFRAAIFELEVSLYWIVLEILGSTYVQRQQLAITYKKERVREFLNFGGFMTNSWSFLSEAIEDWYEVRNAAFHEGNLPTWSDRKFEQRWRQLAEFTSFVLADMLQAQSPSQKDRIGLRLSSY